MANDIYIISPTDGNKTREFSVSPYTSNGNTSPTNAILDSNAVSVNSSLLFQGKGSDSYGERLQENFYHLLENFSSKIEPLNPIQGQQWFDINDNTLKVFQSTGLDIYDIDGNQVVFRLNGNISSKYYQLTKEALILKFQNSYKFDINEILTNDLVGSFIALSAIDTSSTIYVPVTDIGKMISVTVNNLNNIEIPNVVGTTAIKQTVGLWVPVYNTSEAILESVVSAPVNLYNSFYGPIDNLNIGENRIVNIADPIDNLDGINKQFLDTNFLNVAGGTTTGPIIFNGITTFNGNIDIINSTLNLSSSLLTGILDPSNLDHAVNLNYLANNYVDLAGAVMTGLLELSADPVNNLEAATKQYVDSTIAGAGSTLQSLTDVTFAGLLNTHILRYNGTKWINQPDPFFGLTASDFISSTSGGAISTGGSLKLFGQPGQNGIVGFEQTEDAVTVGFMNTTISDEFNTRFPVGDIFVQSGSYNGLLDRLSLGRSASQPDIDINNLGTDIIDNVNSSLMHHIIVPNNTNDGDFLESALIDNGTYPDVDIQTVFAELSKTIKKMQRKNDSTVFVSDGRATPYDLSIISNSSYTNGFNNLQVYINGQKQLSNTRGYQLITQTVSPDIYPGVITGLINDPTVYTFNVDPDSTGNQLISIIGSTAQTYKELQTEINSQLVGCRCVIENSEMGFISDSTGNTSSILITDIDLFSTLTGPVLINAPVSGSTYDYEEIGSYGDNTSTQIQFTIIVPISSVFEFVVLNVGGLSDINGFEI